MKAIGQYSQDYKNRSDFFIEAAIWAFIKQVICNQTPAILNYAFADSIGMPPYRNLNLRG